MPQLETPPTRRLNLPTAAELFRDAEGEDQDSDETESVTSLPGLGTERTERRPLPPSPGPQFPLATELNELSGMEPDAADAAMQTAQDCIDKLRVECKQLEGQARQEQELDRTG